MLGWDGLRRYKLLDSHGNADGVNRGEVELNICWRFNPELVQAEKKGGVGSLLGKLTGDQSDSDVDDDDDEVSVAGQAPVSRYWCIGPGWLIWFE